MRDESWQAFSERVDYEDRLHVDCMALSEPMHEAEATALRERNLNVLTTLTAFDERRSDAIEDETPLMQELARIDSKLNVLMAVVDRLLLPEVNLPARQPIRFNAVGALLPGALLPPGAASILLRIHFDACRALPLELPANITAHRIDDMAFVAFETVGESVGEGLERLVFRHHRRKVAGARQSAQ
ncbi:PilZ domain-containing protein [Dyella subtropica]|uniref:PilZ domain-containing protein n=1 Tax=Dyella subtropica TaxID=2992127 RepID=UPI00224DC6D3|nr:PilZ domain-containing protein [Dyella subtropica]